MSTLRGELAKLDKLGIDAIRDYFALGHWEGRADAISKYLSPRLGSKVFVYGNRVCQMAVDEVKLAEFPAVKAFVNREEELIA